MPLFNLHLEINHSLSTFTLQPHMSLNDIKCTVGKFFHINPNTFEIQVYDESHKNKYVLDDEYLADLHERLPRTHIGELYGDISLNHAISGELKYVRVHSEQYLSISMSKDGKNIPHTDVSLDFTLSALI
jgi:hypothetical protein